MFIKVHELMCDHKDGETIYGTELILINTDRISSIKLDKLLGRVCSGVTLDNTFHYVTETVDEIMDLIDNQDIDFLEKFGIGVKV